MSTEVSKTGVWRDRDGKIVTQQPAEGVQLVAPGGPITPRVRKQIDAAGAKIQTAAVDTGDTETTAMRSGDAPRAGKSTTRR